jgi:hypothetical protein
MHALELELAYGEALGVAAAFCRSTECALLLREAGGAWLAVGAVCSL